jgi:hypothetical protein
MGGTPVATRLLIIAFRAEVKKFLPEEIERLLE